MARSSCSIVSEVSVWQKHFAEVESMNSLLAITFLVGLDVLAFKMPKLKV